MKEQKLTRQLVLVYGAGKGVLKKESSDYAKALGVLDGTGKRPVCWS